MITVYLKPGCPYCANTLRIINERNIKAKKITLETEEEREKIKKKNNYNTFPQIFVDNKLIGGNDDFVKLIDMCDNLNNMMNGIDEDIIKILIKLCCELSNEEGCKIAKLVDTSNKKKKKKLSKKKK